MADSRISSQPRSISSGVVAGPKDRRKAEVVRHSGSPMASSTWLGSTLAELQAEPAPRRKPAESNTSMSSRLEKPGTEKLIVVGTERSNGMLNSTPGNERLSSAAKRSRKPASSE